MATVVTNEGLAIISGLTTGITSLLPKYTAWGTGTGTSAVTDTTLFTEDSGGTYARVVATLSQFTTSVTNDTFQAVGTITADAVKTITNCGLFDASTAGNLFFKADFTGVALNTGDSIQFTFQVEY